MLGPTTPGPTGGHAGGSGTGDLNGGPGYHGPHGSEDDDDGAAQYGGGGDEQDDGVRAPMEAKFDTLYGNHQDPRMLAAAQAAQYGLNRQQREAPPVSRVPSAAWPAG